MIAPLVIVALASAVGVVLWWLVHAADKAVAQLELEIRARNDRVRAVYAQAGAKWYPHVGDDGEVRWLDVDTV